MNELPWIDKEVKHHFLSGPFKGYRIEEILHPWDLMLEAHFLSVSHLSDPFHIERMEQGTERMFSIRNKNRESQATIVCMPESKPLKDTYWSKVRVLHTSKPMTVDDEKLIVLDVVCMKAKKYPKEILEMTKLFFQKHGGVLDEEFPLGLAFHDAKSIKKWKKACNGKINNLCVGEVTAYVKECLAQAYNLKNAIHYLEENSYNDMYLCSDHDWVNQVIDHLIDHPEDRAQGMTWFYGQNREAMLARFNAGKLKTMVA